MSVSAANTVWTLGRQSQTENPNEPTPRSVSHFDFMELPSRSPTSGNSETCGSPHGIPRKIYA